MYLKLIRNKAKSNAITGRLTINGCFFCNTLERVGYQILALCYSVRVTHSPRFKRLLPLVCGVPQKTGIRFHVGTKPEHSTGCILVLGDQIKQPNLSCCSTTPPIGCRTAADVENQLTDLLLKAQNAHEEIILEVTDFRPGTQYGYDTPCPPELQKHTIDSNRAKL
ncbi:MAG: hypothetical protein IKV22_01700 [Paludibacteraceae bacterium]|nr:hypothetical protein [Paludibacteraceae bacterium]